MFLAGRVNGGAGRRRVYPLPVVAAMIGVEEHVAAPHDGHDVNERPLVDHVGGVQDPLVRRWVEVTVIRPLPRSFTCSW